VCGHACAIIHALCVMSLIFTFRLAKAGLECLVNNTGSCPAYTHADLENHVTEILHQCSGKCSQESLIIKLEIQILQTHIDMKYIS